MKRSFRAITVLLCGKHRGRFSPWCSEARSLVGPGTLEHPRLCHGRYRRPAARLSDFLLRGSTLAAWEGAVMEVLYPHCAGLDVHKNSVVACARHMSGGKISTKLRTFKTTTEELMQLLVWLTDQGVTHIAMEATGVYWKPVWHILSDDDFVMVLANAAHVKNVPGRKTDVNDAQWLADLMAHGLIRASFVPDQLPQQMRDLLRTRKQLVRERASHTLRIQKILEEA